MAAPTSDVYQMQFQNPHASGKLVLPVLVLCNTPDEELNRNIRENSKHVLPWVGWEEPHGGAAVLVGGGPSVADHIEEIRALKDSGATIFAMNAASVFLRDHEIECDFQVIADAKPETATLVDPDADGYLVASQVDEATMSRVMVDPDAVCLWHLGIEGMEDLFPDERVKNGGYSLIGGGASVGNSALCLAYVMGYRSLTCFGYDSSHRAGWSHAYPQPMNDIIPTIDVTWAGKTYTSGLAMKAQAEKFQITAQSLKQEGVDIAVIGNGLLPAMYNTPPTDLEERDKYRLMWQFDGYRGFSPGEQLVEQFIDIIRPTGLIVDFGCGTGRASLALSKLGHEVVLVDFADNCRDEEALDLPFLEWDLTHPCPLTAPYGICTDVMEHIPLKDVDTVLKNIMNSAKTCFFQISTVQDVYGDVIGQRLHHTVRPFEWWKYKFHELGYPVKWQMETDSAALFAVENTPANPSEG